MPARREPGKPKGMRRVLNDARSRYEQIVVAVVRWGRADDARRRAGGAGDQAIVAELLAAEDELRNMYHELKSDV